MLASLLLGLVIAALVRTEDFQETREWECDGGVKYYDAPIVVGSFKQLNGTI